MNKTEEIIKTDLGNGILGILDLIKHKNSKTKIESDFGTFTVNFNIKGREYSTDKEYTNKDEEYKYSSLLPDSMVNRLNLDGMYILNNKGLERSHFSYEGGKLYIYLGESYLKRLFKRMEDLGASKNELNKTLKTKSKKKNGCKYYKYIVEKDIYDGKGDPIKKIKIEEFNISSNMQTYISKVNNENTFRYTSFDIFDKNKKSIGGNDARFIKIFSGKDDGDYDNIEGESYIRDITDSPTNSDDMIGFIGGSYLILRTV